MKKYLNYVLFLLGALPGYFLGNYISGLQQLTSRFSLLEQLAYQIGFNVIISVLLGLIVIFLGKWLFFKLVNLINLVAHMLLDVPQAQILGGAFGLIVGLVIAYFLSNVFNSIPIKLVSMVLIFLMYISLGYIGLFIGIRNFSDMARVADLFRKSPQKDHIGGSKKVLDTSSIIDGRIAEVCETGFIEGEIIIPEFVLKELRHIADSSDTLTRSKGRRGLDILQRLQENTHLKVSVTDKDYEDLDEVDMKLVRLAMECNGSVITNDYNLNKVAVVQGVKVLNVNELSNAVKPNAIPGELMYVEIIKEGKEQNQGVAYLPDGTMIVIEDGRSRIGQKLNVMVTSVLQTPAGRMIFAKIEN